MISLVGKSLNDGRYIIDKELGEGGFAITYKAFDREENKEVVIKTLKLLTTSPEEDYTELRKKLQDECRRLVRLSHPNIVQFLDFFAEGRMPCIVMKYVPGQTLEKVVLPNNPLSEETALNYIRQVGEALEGVHKIGLLHRDVKPDNLILKPPQDNRPEQVILIDFGIAREFRKLYGDESKVHTRLASDGYAPIEQYLPDSKLTPATDVYALAATFYTLLTARIPVAPTLQEYDPTTPIDEIRSDLSQKVVEAVKRGMAFEQKDRTQTVKEWLDLLGEERRLVFVPPTIEPDNSKIASANESEKNARVPSNRKAYIRRSVPALAIVAALAMGVEYAWLEMRPSSEQKNQVNGDRVIPALPSSLETTKSTSDPSDRLPSALTIQKPQQPLLSPGQNNLQTNPKNTSLDKSKSNSPSSPTSSSKSQVKATTPTTNKRVVKASSATPSGFRTRTSNQKEASTAAKPKVTSSKQVRSPAASRNSSSQSPVIQYRKKQVNLRKPAYNPPLNADDDDDENED